MVKQHQQIKNDYAVREHDYIIKNSGGLTGIKDSGALKATLDFVKNDIFYPEYKVAYLFYSINKNHAFSDGNKRSSIT